MARDQMAAMNKQLERLCKPYTDLKSQLPEGRSGRWFIDQYEVPMDFQWLRFAKEGRGMPTGKYKRLVCGNDTVMSDTPAEIADFMPFVKSAKGHLLVTGLGMGLFVRAALENKAVESITVVEKSTDVIALSAKQFEGNDRVTIHCADAFEFKPTRKFTMAWHDIWNSDGFDAEYKAIKAHYRPFVSGRQGIWCPTFEAHFPVF